MIADSCLTSFLTTHQKQSKIRNFRLDFDKLVCVSQSVSFSLSHVIYLNVVMLFKIVLFIIIIMGHSQQSSNACIKKKYK